LNMNRQLLVRMGWIIAALAAAGAVGLAPNTYWLYLLGMTAAYTIVGTGLNLLIGLSGQVSLGHAGFYAVGAYVTAILSTRYGLSYWLTLPLCMLVPAALGALLAAPALRVKGPYLAMVTIAFGLVLQNVLIEAEPLTGGFNGISNIDKPMLGATTLSLRAHVGVMVGFAALSLLAYTWMARSRFGRLLRAVRDSEIAARSIGINPWRIKTAVFVVSAALAGLAGGLFAPMAGFISPENFDLLLSIQFLLLVILGGLETRAGPLVGALVIAALPEALSGLAEYRLLFFGTLLFLILAVMPKGIAGTVGRLLLRGRPTKRLSTNFVARGRAERAHAWLAARGPSDPLIAENLGIQFGGLKAVDNMSLHARAGVVTGLIGPNGAGKTSVLNMLGGFYRPTEGAVRLGQLALPAGRSEACARAGIARTFQTTLLFDSLTVFENVALALPGGSDSTLAHDLLVFAGYQGDPDHPAGDLSFVDRRMVEIARALATRPRALLLDEPAAGLGKNEKLVLAATLSRIASCGLTVVLVEHDMPLVMQACTDLVAMENGRVLSTGAAESVRTDPAVIAAYLGVSGNIARTPRKPAQEVVLEAQGLAAGYGQIGVLEDVSVQVRRHEVVAVVGANGAGKSTLMRAFTGLLSSTGSILLNGKAPQLRPDRMARAGLVMVPEGRQVFPRLSVRDNLLLGGYATPAAVRQHNLELMLARFPRLAERVEHDAGLLSGGEQQMLAIARGLMAMPTIIIFDEPSLGLAPKIVHVVYETIDALAADGMTVMLVDQFAAMALAIADRGYVLTHGRVVADGPAQMLLNDASVRTAYLGEAANESSNNAAVTAQTGAA
jgi:branched-chain amino acid transport system ATP-binding protein